MKKELIPENFMLRKKSDGKLFCSQSPDASKKDDTVRKILRLDWNDNLNRNE